MNKKVYLYTPKLEELWYREQMMIEPDTMGYNKGYEEFEGYDKETGCIAFPLSRWNTWYEKDDSMIELSITKEQYFENMNI